MEREFRPRTGERNTLLLCLLGFLLFAFAFTYWGWKEGRFDEYPEILFFAVFGTGFWGFLACVCVWNLLAYKRERLTFTQEQIIFQGLIRRKDIEFGSIRELIWRPTPSGRVLLFTSTDRLVIDLDVYELIERLWIVRTLEGKVPKANQQNWEIFCLKVAVPLQEGKKKPATPPTPGPNEATITRRRWDWYFLPAVGLLFIFGIIMWWSFQQPRFLFALPLLIGLWFLIRIQTPKEGFVGKRLNSEPELVRFLRFLFIWTAAAFLGMKLFSLLHLQPPVSYIVGTIVSFAWMGIILWRASLEDRNRRH